MKKLLSLVIVIAVACNQRAELRLHDGKAVSTALPVFDLGDTKVDSLIEAWDIDVRPDGQGLPPGSALPADGNLIYQQKCSNCHGVTGKEGPMGALVSAVPDTGRAKTVGNYWPYATTLFDYIRRAMPYNQPGSLTNEEVYALCAWILHQNQLIAEDFRLDQQSLPTIEMPAKKFYVPDDRTGGPTIR
jgi:mono/diheme cytochrome c family protein